MKPKNKYAELLKRKRGKFTADGRPIEIYSRGKEKIYVAFDSGNNMEIVAHNPLPLLAAALPSLVRTAPAIVGGASNLLGRKKAVDEPLQPKIKGKSLTANIIEREVYNDKDFSMY